MFLYLNQVLKELFVLDVDSQSLRPRCTSQPFTITTATTPKTLSQLLGN